MKAKRKGDKDLMDFEDVGPMQENAAQADEIRRIRSGS